MADAHLDRKVYTHDDGTECEPNCSMYGDDKYLPVKEERTYPNPDQDDWEHVGHVPHLGAMYWVYVTKLGGGTIGRTYPGSWYVKVKNAETDVVLLDDRLTRHMDSTHVQIALLALQFIEDADS